MSPLDRALEALDGYIATNKHPDSAVLRARLRAMIRAYSFVWAGQEDQYEVLAVEQLLLAPLVNLVNKKESDYLAGGKLDVILREREGRKRLLLSDHKFLGFSFDDSDIQHLMIAAQPLEYGYLAFANGKKLDDAMWDVIAKPSHIPRKESSRIVRAGSEAKIAGRTYTDSDGIKRQKGDLVPAREEIREATPAETMEEFEERVYNVLIENKDKYFARPRVPLLRHQIAEHCHEKYLWVQEMKMDAASEIHLKNTDACKTYSSPCQYMGLCLGTSSEDDGTWKKTDRIHAELDLPDGVDPGRVVTNSRLGMYKSCRLKHHRRYNLGLVKIKSEEADALYVGSGGHVALEMFWKAIAFNQGRDLFKENKAA